MFDRARMTSGIFQEPGHSQVGEGAETEWFREGKPEGISWLD